MTLDDMQKDIDVLLDPYQTLDLMDLRAILIDVVEELRSMRIEKDLNPNLDEDTGSKKAVEKLFILDPLS